MDSFGEVITGRAFAAPAGAPAVQPRHEPEVLLAAARRPARPARRVSSGLAAGVAASALVHAVLLGALLQTRVGRVEQPAPPPVFLELPPPFPLPMPAAEAEADVPEVQAETPAATGAALKPRTEKLDASAPAPRVLSRPVEPMRAPAVQAAAPAPAPATAPSAEAGPPPAPAPAPKVEAPSPAPPPQASADNGYEGRVMARLAQAKRYPTAARARREEGTAQVRFTVSREGRVSGVVLARSSGSTALDREAMDTVRRAQPLPPVPAGAAAPMQMTLGVSFKLR